MYLLQAVYEVLQLQIYNLYQLLFAKRVKIDNFVNSIEKFRCKCLFQVSLYQVLFHCGSIFLYRRGRKSNSNAKFAQSSRSHVGRHDDYGVSKIDFSSRSIAQATFVQDLQQQIEHIAVCFLNLVKQYNRIRMCSDFFGQLSCLFVTHIARRRSYELAYAVLFHKFAHVEAD